MIIIIKTIEKIHAAIAGTLPNFIIVGTMKGGTTSLYTYLATHPKVRKAEKKAIHYFDKHFENPVSWYRSHFPSSLRTMGKQTFDASPYYLVHPLAAKRIAEVVPRAHIIALLRNPVDRAISHYWHEVNKGREDLPMREAFERENARLEGEEAKTSAGGYSSAHQRYTYLQRGVYVDQIKRYHKYFSKTRVLLLKSEDLFMDTQRTYDEVLAFLDLSPHQLVQVKGSNVGVYKKDTDESVRQWLQEYFEPHNQRPYEYLATDRWW